MNRLSQLKAVQLEGAKLFEKKIKTMVTLLLTMDLLELLSVWEIKLIGLQVLQIMVLI